MRVRVQKRGRRLAVRIPKSIAREMELEEGSALDLRSSRGKLVATPVHPSRTHLDEFLAGVTKGNLNGEFELGPVAGCEVW